jgi:hypothetical protein
MNIGTPRTTLLPAFDIPKVAQPKVVKPHKPYKPTEHPQRDRLAQAQATPSLITAPDPSNTPTGKGGNK